MALVLLIEVLDASTSTGQQLVNRPNSVWDWVYVMPPSPFFFSATVYPSRPSLSSLDSNPSRTERASHVAPQISVKEFIVLPSNELYFSKDYCLIGRPVSPVFTNFLIYLTYIISGMILIYSSKKSKHLVSSLRRSKEKPPKRLQRA